VKTGITNTAGSCLCVAYENKKLNKKIVTVVLGCRNMEYRWKDARRLTLWADSLLQQQAMVASSPTKIKRNEKGYGGETVKSRFD
jgi:D-alanyl-D-alanine carboxypeptidase